MELKDLNNSATLLFKIYVRVIAAKWLKLFSLKIFFTQIHVTLKSQRLKLHFFSDFFVKIVDTSLILKGFLPHHSP